MNKVEEFMGKLTEGNYTEGVDTVKSILNDQLSEAREKAKREILESYGFTVTEEKDDDEEDPELNKDDKDDDKDDEEGKDDD